MVRRSVHPPHGNNPIGQKKKKKKNYLQGAVVHNTDTIPHTKKKIKMITKITWCTKITIQPHAEILLQRAVVFTFFFSACGIL